MKLPKKLSNQVKKKKLTKNDDLKTGIRHLGIIVEHIDDKVSLVAEHYGDIKKDISDIKDTLNSHTEMIGKLKIDVTIVKEDVAFIKGSLKKKIDVEEFSALERRVALLEKRR